MVREDFWETLSLHNNYFKTITLKISLSPSKDMFQVFACIWNMLHELPFKYKGLKFRFVDIDYVKQNLIRVLNYLHCVINHIIEKSIIFTREEKIVEKNLPRDFI